ncbi:hypothetical protein [Paenibacillus humicus]|uniref:hypothetical protein n=1 Tax=Paenibacillus humicus TaxID=412861 RepID=UPI000FDBB67D|nr:hypothetical protein [Paenibacillus humicus]
MDEPNSYSGTNQLSQIQFSDGSYFKYQYDLNGNVINKRKLQQGNMLVNPGFEYYSNQNGVADGWNKEAWGGAVETMAVLETGDAPSGSKVQRVQARDITDGNYAGIVQTIKVKEGKTFTSSGKFKVEELKNAKLQYHIDFLSEPGKYVGAFMDEAAQTSNGEYYTLSISGKVPSGAKMAYVFVLIRGNGGIGPGTVYVDLLNFHYGEANSLGNGSFEDYSRQTGVADAWNKVAWEGAVETMAG